MIFGFQTKEILCMFLENVPNIPVLKQNPWACTGQVERQGVDHTYVAVLAKVWAH